MIIGCCFVVSLTNQSDSRRTNSSKSVSSYQITQPGKECNYILSDACARVWGWKGGFSSPKPDLNASRGVELQGIAAGRSACRKSAHGVQIKKSWTFRNVDYPRLLAPSRGDVPKIWIWNGPRQKRTRARSSQQPREKRFTEVTHIVQKGENGD